MNHKFTKYPPYKDSGDEWLGNIPEEWESIKVKNVFRLLVEPSPKNQAIDFVLKGYNLMNFESCILTNIKYP